jgi:acylpyruvate hydrolase
MRLGTLRLDDQRTAAARQDGDEFVLLPYDNVGTLLASGSNWQERARACDATRVPP